MTSRDVHDFSASNAATTLTGTIDDLLKPATMDLRCRLDSDEAIARNHALIGVYSDTRKANLAAARGYCAANTVHHPQSNVRSVRSGDP